MSNNINLIITEHEPKLDENMQNKLTEFISLSPISVPCSVPCSVPSSVPCSVPLLNQHITIPHTRMKLQFLH